MVGVDLCVPDTNMDYILHYTHISLLAIMRPKFLFEAFDNTPICFCTVFRTGVDGCRLTKRLLGIIKDQKIDVHNLIRMTESVYIYGLKPTAI